MVCRRKEAEFPGRKGNGQFWHAFCTDLPIPQSTHSKCPEDLTMNLRHVALLVGLVALTMLIAAGGQIQIGLILTVVLTLLLCTVDPLAV